MLWKLSLKILTPYCQTCKKEDLLWETSTTHSQLHIDVEAGLSLMKSTIAESGMGVTSRP